MAEVAFAIRSTSCLLLAIPPVSRIWSTFSPLNAGNNPVFILSAVCQAFDTHIFSEYEPKFWGFDTQEEWDEAMTN